MPVTQNQSNKVSSAIPAGNPESVHKENSNKNETESHRRESPENCSICLGPFNNKSFTSSCAHSFCFVCLKQWSKVKAECPLCKQPFTSIFHNIRSDQSYDIYELPVLPPRHNGFEFYFPSSLTTFSAHTHPYLNFAQPSLDADLTLSNFSRFQFRHRRYDRFPQHTVHGEHQYSFHFNPATHVSAASWPRGAEDFRRAVYKHRLGPPLFILGNETSTYRLTPAMMVASGHRLQRIMPWLTRELKVLLKSHQSVRFAISIIQPLLTQVLIDSIQFSEKVSPLIGRKSHQFIQEFVAFANSALTVQAFDRKAIYFRQDTSSLLLDNSSRSDSDDDDVVEITDVSSDPEIIGRTSPVPGSSGLFRAGWDSPTPGPSWENLDVNRTCPPLEIETVSVSSEGDDPVFRPDLVDSDSSSKSGSDIVFLKYDKPWTERSPIQLSSDSDSVKICKKRKSKHKRKRRNPSGIEVYKSNEIINQKKSCEDEILTFKETSSALRKKRENSSTSGKPKRKKKKSRDVDRELVDKLVAKALSQKLNASNTMASNEQDGGPCSSKDRENIGILNLSEKGKNKHKKKVRKNSGDSQSSFNLHSYKKHHSGHKKSGERIGSESIRQKHNAQDDNIPDCETSCWDTQVLRTQPLTSQAIVGHSSYQQSNYIPDTLQHIPLNLWVSAWPAIPTTHTFSTAPPSSSFLTSSLPLSNNSALDSHTLLSETSSDTDSDDTEHYSISSVTSSLRTKQWLEDNFPHPDKNIGKSSKSKKVISPPKLSTNEKQCQVILNTSENVEIVLSISDDEDVVVCSSSVSSSNRSEINIHNDKDVNTNDSDGLEILYVTSNSLAVQKEETEVHSASQPISENAESQVSIISLSQSSSVQDTVIEKVKDDGFLSDKTKNQTNEHLFEYSNMNQVSEIHNTDSTNLDLVQSSEKVSSHIINPLTSSTSLSCASKLEVEYKPTVSLSTLLLTSSPSDSLTSSSMFPEQKIEPLNLSLHCVTSLNTEVFPVFHSFSQPCSHVTPTFTISKSEALYTLPDSSKSTNVMSSLLDGHGDNLENVSNENNIELQAIHGLNSNEDSHAVTDVSSEQQKDTHFEECSIHLGNDSSPAVKSTEQIESFDEKQHNS